MYFANSSCMGSSCYTVSEGMYSYSTIVGHSMCDCRSDGSIKHLLVNS